jgi:hypothetical protein
VPKDPFSKRTPQDPDTKCSLSHPVVRTTPPATELEDISIYICILLRTYFSCSERVKVILSIFQDTGVGGVLVAVLDASCAPSRLAFSRSYSLSQTNNFLNLRLTANPPQTDLPFPFEFPSASEVQSARKPKHCDSAELLILIND